MIYLTHLVLAIFFTLLFPAPLKHIDITLEPKPVVVNPPPPTPEELILKGMTIEEKVGQLFIFGFDGTSLSEDTREFLEKYNVGGVLLLKKNIANETELKQLIEHIQSTNDIPLFISIDQEGGTVARIKWDSKLTKAQASISTPKESYNDAKYKGEYLKSLGVNMNFAPVVEYITDSNSFLYNRVYRGNKDDVYLKSISAIDGYAQTEVISVPKHYPGHSDTSTDSHYTLPAVRITDAQWDEYIQPFSKILENTDVNAMMVGHVQFPNIDSEYPTTLSHEIINNRLIEDLEYDGLIISDDMEMDALDDIDTYPRVAKKALEAGNDVLIYSKYSSRYPTIQRDVYEYIVEEVKKGNIDIDKKVLKILKMKLMYNILSTE